MKAFILLAIVVFLTYGQIVKLDLWQDDNALVFKLQHTTEAAGVFGPGILGLGAYRYVAAPYFLLYKFVGVNLPVFYALCLLFYLMAVLSVYFLSIHLLRDKFLAFFPSLIFAGGFIGSDGILRLFNSIQTSYSIALACLLFITLATFAKNRKLIFYLISLLLFFLTMEGAYVRTQYLLVPTIAFWLLFVIRRKKLVKDIVLSLPFFAIYYLVFLRSPDPRTQVINKFIQEILSGKLEYTHGFWGTLGNIIVPQPLTNFLFSITEHISLDLSNELLMLQLLSLVFFCVVNFLVLSKHSLKIKVGVFLLQLCWFAIQWIFFQESDFIPMRSKTEQTHLLFANFIGGLFFITCSLSSILLFKINKRFGCISVFAILWMYSNILVYSIYLPFSPLGVIDRYITHSLAPYTLLLTVCIFCHTSSFYGKSRGKLVTVVLVSIITVCNIVFSVQYQTKFINEKTIPTKNFYKDLKVAIPKIEKGTIIYFDVGQDEISSEQFKDFFSVGSMPNSTAIAVRYGIDRYDLSITEDFKEFVTLINEKETPTNKIFSFFFKNNVLVDTTEKLRQVLVSGGQYPLNKTVYLSQNEFVFSGLQAQSGIPLSLDLEAEASIDLSKLPINCANKNKTDLRLIFQYLISQSEYLKNSKAITTSSEKHYEPDFLLDSDESTLWRGNRGWWHYNQNETVKIDLGSLKSIGELRWTNGYANSTPTQYKIMLSKDGTNWQEVKTVIANIRKNNGQIIRDTFPSEIVRYVNFVIEKTYDFDSPAISEIEVVEEKFISINPQTASEVDVNPIKCIQNKKEADDLVEFIRNRGVKTYVAWKTSEEDWTGSNTKSFFIYTDGLSHKYKVNIFPKGTKLTDIKIGPTVPINLYFDDIKLTYPTKGKLIEEYAKF